MLMTFNKGVPISEQRLKVAMAKCVRKHGKRHRTGKRKSALYRARKAKTAAKVAAKQKKRSRFIERAHEYWTGESEVHP